MTTEVVDDGRFGFGENWARFIQTITQDQIDESVSALRDLVGSDLNGRTFLDIGSGSGLSSLAARKLGAEVVSFDYDPQSVGCTSELKRRYFPDDLQWRVQQGSVLDRDFILQLGRFDIVYSWGVLHHTGDMWSAIKNAGLLVKPGGKYAIGIYNFLGGRRGTATWKKLKRWYCSAPKWQQRMWEAVYIAYKWIYLLAVGRNPIKIIRAHRSRRGMSWFRDVTDWLGGYPYEAATPGEVLEFVRREHGYVLVKQNINCDLGVSEFVFESCVR